MNQKIGKLKSVAFAVWYFYLFTVIMIATPYYNWQFAHENGFVSWIMFNEIAPTFKAAFWPVSICIDRHAAHVREENEAGIMRYAAQMRQYKDTATMQMHQLYASEGFSRIRDPKVDRKQKLDLYIALSDANKRIQHTYLSEVTQLKPPEDAIKFHEAIVADAQGCTAYMDDFESKVLHSDKDGSAKVTSDIVKFETESQKKIATAAEEAHFKDWESLVVSFSKVGS